MSKWNDLQKNFNPFYRLLDARAAATAVPANGTDPDGAIRDHNVLIVVNTFAIFAILGVLVILTRPQSLTLLGWAGACLMVGCMAGFLFGFPRVQPEAGAPNPAPHQPAPAGQPPGQLPANPQPVGGQQPAPQQPGQPQAQPAPAPQPHVEPQPAPAPRSSLAASTNLEQIADGLTKMIVGVTLVELRNVPSYLESITDWVVSGLDGTAAEQVSQPFVGALSVYFAVLGFLVAYLLARLFLTEALRRA
jgi:hypothetical protein